MLEHPVHTGSDLKRWRARLGWSQRQAAYWWGCTQQAWHKMERQPWLSLAVIRRLQDFEYVRHQGYIPTKLLPVPKVNHNHQRRIPHA